MGNFSENVYLYAVYFILIRVFHYYFRNILASNFFN